MNFVRILLIDQNHRYHFNFVFKIIHSADAWSIISAEGAAFVISFMTLSQYCIQVRIIEPIGRNKKTLITSKLSMADDGKSLILDIILQIALRTETRNSTPRNLARVCLCEVVRLWYQRVIRPWS
jgi:hypothetical protein